MPNKVSYIIALKDRFSKVADKFNAKFKKIDESAGRANESLKEFGKRGFELKKLSKSLSRFGVIMTAGLTAPMMMFTKSMVAAASDAQETANKFNAVFDDVNKSANSVADSFADSFGLAGSTSRKLLSDTGDLLVGFGFTGQAALDLSKMVNQLAGDLTSFQNVEGGIPRASEALTKALLGETESAKSLGIVIRQDTEEFRNHVEALKITKGLTEQQAKALAIFSQAQSQSKKAIGDVAATWDDYASVARRSEEANKAMRESFGKILLPMATKVNLALTSLANRLSSLSPTTKKVVLVIGGLVAIAGPLLLLVGGLIAAFSVVSLTVMGVSAAIVGVVAVSTVLAANWDSLITGAKNMWIGFTTSLKQNFSGVYNVLSAMFDGLGTAFSVMIEAVKLRLGALLAPFRLLFENLSSVFSSFVDVVLNRISALVSPINAVAGALGFGGADVSPASVPMRTPDALSATLTGNITVAAQPGSRVVQTGMTTKSDFDVGLNMVGGNG